ncbi:MAG: hypothetical protein KGZ58_03245 [Ignavibacteriales bacterium]|nr:hypothetical protein [Ignavibacteriales bacterium]
MTVAELSKEEFKTIISEVVEEKIRQLLDPDYGLELREDFLLRLNKSASSKERISFDDVKKNLGLA